MRTWDRPAGRVGLGALCAASLAGALAVPGAHAATGEGVATVICPQGTYQAPGNRELDDYSPFRSTDGTVLAPKSFGEITVVLRTEGEPTEVGTLSPSSLGSADRGGQPTSTCSFTWTRAYAVDGRRHLDSYAGTFTAVISGRAS